MVALPKATFIIYSVSLWLFPFSLCPAFLARKQEEQCNDKNRRPVQIAMNVSSLYGLIFTVPVTFTTNYKQR